MPLLVVLDSPLLLETTTPHQRGATDSIRNIHILLSQWPQKSVQYIVMSPWMKKEFLHAFQVLLQNFLLFRDWLRFTILTACVHAKSVPTISTFGLFIGILTILLECSFMFVHLNCFISLGKIFDNYLFRIVFYSVSSTVGVILHYEKEKEPTLFTIFIFFWE